ncbi:unnamed protein product [Camellia sinensis]
MEKLCSMLKDVLKSKPNVDVVKHQKSGGVVSRNAKVRQKARSYRIIYRIGGGPQAPRSALPIGAEPATDPTRLVLVNINQDLLHLVLAISFAKEPDQIISRKKITYLAPSAAGELPSRFLIMGTLTWLET